METKKADNLHEGHRKRVRNRFMNEGLTNFEPHQVLELLLFYVVKRADTNELAHQMIAELGSLSAVLDAPPEELAKFPYMTENAIALLKLMPELAAYYRNDRLKNIQTLDNYNALFSYVRAMYTAIHCETVMLILMDGKSRVIKSEKIFEGSVNSTQLDARLIAIYALRHDASLAVLVHNHPDGNASPSRKDVETTLLLKRRLEGIGVNLIEHLVVGYEDVTPIIQSALKEQLQMSLIDQI